MFQVSFLVKDPKLAEVMRILDGKVYELKVLPVRNGTSGPVGQQSAADLVRAAIAEHEGKFTTTEIAQKSGVSNANVRGVLGAMMRTGTLRKISRGNYVNKGRKA